ncbi:MAG: metal-sulfur cluster assembly factor [Verrucomicrobia bacterium]|nr:metal-sulfur cluster assembly factor [Verrucomicrobiota bacterium]
MTDEVKEQGEGQTLTDEQLQDAVRELLKTVLDPELHMNIVDLGLLYDVRVKDGAADIDMTLTTPGCPYGPQLLYQVDQTAQTQPGIKAVNLNVIWNPPWGPDRMSEEAKLELGFDL